MTSQDEDLDAGLTSWFSEVIKERMKEKEDGQKTPEQPDFDCFNNLTPAEEEEYHHERIPVFGGEGDIRGISKVVKFHRLEKMPLETLFARYDVIERLLMHQDRYVPRIISQEMGKDEHVITKKREPLFTINGYLVEPLEKLFAEHLPEL